jgi:hypothetical protein
MKKLGTLTMAVVLLFLAASLGAYAQDRPDSQPGQAQAEKVKDKDKDKIKQNDKDKDKDKHEMNDGAQDEMRDHDQPGTKQDERRSHQQDQRMQKENDQRSAGQMDRDHHQHAAGAKQGKKIPDDKFRSNFGQQHKFRVKEVIHETRVVPGQTQFVYSGYTFVFVDPWPAEWAFTDDCYVDFVDDEYVLVNPFHPGFYVALTVIG